MQPVVCDVDDVCHSVRRKDRSTVGSTLDSTPGSWKVSGEVLCDGRDGATGMAGDGKDVTVERGVGRTDGEGG